MVYDSMSPANNDAAVHPDVPPLFLLPVDMNGPVPPFDISSIVYKGKSDRVDLDSFSK